MKDTIHSKDNGIKIRNTDLWINENTTCKEVAEYINSAEWTTETIEKMIDLFAKFQKKKVRYKAIDVINKTSIDNYDKSLISSDIQNIN